AWKITRGRGVVVAVVDSGVDAGVPELLGAVTPGADFAGLNSDGRVDTDPVSHGTIMAELVAARGASRGMKGVAPESQILPITISRAGKFPDAIGPISAKAIRWATDRGASIISMSYGGAIETCAGQLQDAIWYALDHNVLLVASAGNRADFPIAPATCAGVIAV